VCMVTVGKTVPVQS